jgi:protein tyrosine kinase modulator
MRASAFEPPRGYQLASMASGPAALLPAPGSARALSAAGTGISLMQVQAIARSYWRQALFIWALLTVALALLLLLMPKLFTATTTLVVDQSGNSTISPQQTSPDQLAAYLAEQTELLTSPALLRPVVLQLGLTSKPEWGGGFGGDQRALPDYVAKRLADSLQVQVSPNDQLVYVSATAASPAEAAQIANAVVNQYFMERRGRAARYEEQLSELRARVATAQANLAAFRSQKDLTDVGDLSQRTDTTTQALDDLEAKLLDAQNQRRALEARLSSDPLSSEEALASPQVQQLRADLRTQQAELSQARTLYGARHPKILALESQIAATRRALAGERNLLRTDLTTQLNRARSLEAQYTQAVAQQRGKVMQVRDLQGQGGRLELDLQSAQEVYKDALASYEQAMFSSVDRFTNLRVITAASPPVYSSKTKKRQWLLKGSLAALLIGFALSFGYELLLNRRLRCVDDLERTLGLRVLGQIDAMPPPNRI